MAQSVRWITWCIARPPPITTKPVIAPLMSQGLQHVLEWLDDYGQVPNRLLFVSSSSVYGQQDGEWVDETSPTIAAGYSGRLMLEAEQVALQSGIPASIVRLTGIYGPGREWLLTQVRRGYRVAIDPPLYGNRIHADDAAGLMAFLLEADRRGVALDDVYIGVDDAPAPLAEVVGWLREYLGVTEWAEDASVRRTGSKQCSNARAKALGWTPKYPSYREGYAAILEGAQLRTTCERACSRAITQLMSMLPPSRASSLLFAGSDYCFSSNHLRSPGVNDGISSA